MQVIPTHRSSASTPLLIAALGVGALAAYALSSPRRRAALLAAGESAVEAGSRLAAASAERLRDVPAQTRQVARGMTGSARSASGRVASATTDTLDNVVDRTSAAMHEVLSRVRKLAADTTRRSRDGIRGARHVADEGSVARSTGGGVLIAAAVIGSGLYAMRRYGASARVRDKLGVDESGMIVTEKSVFIDAPIEQVFGIWENVENFPRFMSNVRDVQDLGGGRSHWKVRGPMGVNVEFDSIMRKQLPSELAWESEPGSAVRHEGRVTLVPEGSGTRATVRMAYQLPAGALGQAASSLLGANPKQELGDDLTRMKQFIEGRRAGV